MIQVSFNPYSIIVEKKYHKFHYIFKKKKELRIEHLGNLRPPFSYSPPFFFFSFVFLFFFCFLLLICLSKSQKRKEKKRNMYTSSRHHSTKSNTFLFAESRDGSKKNLLEVENPPPPKKKFKAFQLVQHFVLCGLFFFGRGYSFSLAPSFSMLHNN